jgi:FtsZ-interacting cell division protein YlmF
MNWISRGITTERRARVEEEYEDEGVEDEASAHDQASAILFNYQASQPQPQPQYQNQQYNAGYNYGQPQTQNFGGVFDGRTLSERHILVITPRSDQEVFGIVGHLKTNEAVIVNFDGIPVCETQRRIDFLSGVACGMGGTIRPLDSHKYIITPSGVGVR